MLTHLAHPTSYSELHFEFEPAFNYNILCMSLGCAKDATKAGKLRKNLKVM